MLTALGSIATQQEDPTENTMRKGKQFLNPATTHPNSITAYQSRDMILAVHSDDYHLSETNSKIRAGGHFFMSSDSLEPPSNGVILNIAKIIKVVISSAAEAELGVLYINCKEAIPSQHAPK